jgi:hypothetical protein
MRSVIPCLPASRCAGFLNHFARPPSHLVTSHWPIASNPQNKRARALVRPLSWTENALTGPTRTHTPHGVQPSDGRAIPPSTSMASAGRFNLQDGQPAHLVMSMRRRFPVSLTRLYADMSGALKDKKLTSRCTQGQEADLGRMAKRGSLADLGHHSCLGRRRLARKCLLIVVFLHSCWIHARRGEPASRAVMSLAVRVQL